MKYTKILMVVLSIGLVSCGSASSPGKKVTASEFGKKWPLTVSDGYVDCINPYQAAVFRTGGNVYALNGFATSKGYSDIRPIWKDNPEIPGTKLYIGPLVDAALALCK